MFVLSQRLRKIRGGAKFMEADNGAGSGGDAVATVVEDTKTDTNDNKDTDAGKEVKTFTQEDVDKMIKDRLARATKGQLSKEEFKAYQDWKDSQKTEDEKKSEAISNAENAKKAAEEKAANLEAKVACLSKGVNPNSTDDVVILAKAMVTDEITIEKAIDKVLERYPHFKGDQKEEQKGFKKVGSGGGNGKVSESDALAKVFGNIK